uniref:Peptide transporter PTR2 n=1 Tax=Aegilops tauschii TaxID=37682 RepID=M8C848_AEGTA
MGRRHRAPRRRHGLFPRRLPRGVEDLPVQGAAGQPPPPLLAGAAVMKRRLQLPADAGQLYEEDDGKKRLLCHTDQLRCLDKAAIFEHGGEVWSGAWRLATVTQVEETKLVVSMVPIWVATLPFGMAAAQVSTFFIKQGMAMDRHLGPHFVLPPASVFALAAVAMIATVALVDKVLEPCLRRATGAERATRAHRGGRGVRGVGDGGGGRRRAPPPALLRHHVGILAGAAVRADGGRRRVRAEEDGQALAETEALNVDEKAFQTILSYIHQIISKKALPAHGLGLKEPLSMLPIHPATPRKGAVQPRRELRSGDRASLTHPL